jgi:hypothetical protein
MLDQQRMRVLGFDVQLRGTVNPIYWTKNVTVEGADRLPAPSTAIMK